MKRKLRNRTFQVWHKPEVEKGKDLSDYEWNLYEGIDTLEKAKEIADALKTINVLIREIEYREGEGTIMGVPVKEYGKFTLDGYTEWDRGRRIE